MANVHCYAAHEADEVFVEPREAIEGCFDSGAAIVPVFYFVPLDDGTMLVAHHRPELGSGGEAKAARFETIVTEADFEAGLPIPEELSFDVSVAGREDGTRSEVSIHARFTDATYRVEADALLRDCNLRWPYARDSSECSLFEPPLNCP